MKKFHIPYFLIVLAIFYIVINVLAKRYAHFFDDDLYRGLLFYFNVLCFSLFLCLCHLKKRSLACIGAAVAFFSYLETGIGFLGAHDHEGVTGYLFAYWLVVGLVLTVVLTFLMHKADRIVALGLSVLSLHVVILIYYFAMPFLIESLHLYRLMSFSHEPFNAVSFGVVFFFSYLMVKGLLTLMHYVHDQYSTSRLEKGQA